MITSTATIHAVALTATHVTHVTGCVSFVPAV